MSCPYCLAFSEKGAHRLKNIKTLVRSYWEFEENLDTWQGFSPAVSGLLEASYLSWKTDRVLRKAPQIKSGMFVYQVDFASMNKDKSASDSKRIRRVGVTDGGPDANTLGYATCTMEPKLYKEFEQERDLLVSDVEKLKTQFDEERSEWLRVRREMQAELDELRSECSEKQAELEQLRQELHQEREGGAVARLRRCLSSIWPGRLVSLAPGHASCTPAGLLPGSLGRVRAVEGESAAVDFPGHRDVWVPCECLEPAPSAHLLTCPGSRVEWHGKTGTVSPSTGTNLGALQRGVVCGCRDDLTVDVLGVDGRKRACSLRDLSAASDRPPVTEPPVEVGDLVRIEGEEGLAQLRERGLPGLPSDCIGMVVCSDSSGITVRLRDPHPDGSRVSEEGHTDITFEPHGRGVVRDEAACNVRPGVAVRLRGTLHLDQVGTVYATHGDGTAVADFPGAMGRRCSVASLEVVKAPNTVDYAMLRVLSESLSWLEVSLQQAEDREEEAIVHWISTLPSMSACSGMLDQAAPDFRVVEWDCQSTIFRFVTRLLMGPLGPHAGPDGDASGDRPPLLSIQRVEALHNPGLLQAYELATRRCRALHPDGCPELPDCGAFQVQGGNRCNEVFLWYGAALEAADRYCRDGFSPRRIEGADDGAGLLLGPRFAARSSDAELHTAAQDCQDQRCLILARVLLGNSKAAAEDDSPAEGATTTDGSLGSFDSFRVAGSGEDRPEFTVRTSSQALPLFRVFYRHEAGC